MFSNHRCFEYLIFDLDETLYPRNAGLLREINRRISQYICDLLRIPFSDADILRADLNLEYGTTLRGLQVQYQINTEEYLQFVHQIPLEEYLKPSAWLREMLVKIPLSKVIFTNSDRDHARRVIEMLGIADQFSLIFDVRAMGFHNKPSPQVYRALLATLKVKGDHCIFVDDSARNLQTAKQLFGMLTIMIDSQSEAVEAVDFILSDLSQLGKTLANIL